MSDDYASIDGSAYQAYLDSLTDKQLQVVREKEKRLDEIEKQIIENQLTSRAVTKYVLPGSFMMYQQETDTYCVPACIKSALIYIIGISQTQSEINSVIKKDFAKIPAYMNLMQNKSTYLLTDLRFELVQAAKPCANDLFLLTGNFDRTRRNHFYLADPKTGKLQQAEFYTDDVRYYFLSASRNDKGMILLTIGRDRMTNEESCPDKLYWLNMNDLEFTPCSETQGDA